MGGNCITLQLKKGGFMEFSDVITHEGSSKDTDRQEAPHPHSIVPDPLSKFVYVADLGIDKIMIYEINYKEGKLYPAKTSYQKVRSGSGPRHLIFYNNSGYAYVVNELNSTITAFVVDHELGRLSEIQTISTIPNNFSGTNWAADIHIRNDFLYASNRGHNSIAIFKIDRKTGKLQPVKCESVQGKTPRNFAIDPTGKFVLVANEDTNNITCFKINNTTGDLEYTGFDLQVPMPQCIKFIT
jgi:6-phosphogluconolactonase